MVNREDPTLPNQPSSFITPDDDQATRRSRRIVVYANPQKEKVGGVIESIAQWCQAQSVQLYLDNGFEPSMKGQGLSSNKTLSFYNNGDAQVQPLTAGTDGQLLVCLGGDGTMLHAVRRFWPFDAPVLGVNLGQMGFNAAVGPNEAVLALDSWFRGDYQCSRRMTVKVRLIQHGAVVAESVAVNDVVLAKQHSENRLIHLRLRQQDEIISDFSADGLIVSTPTGSTAYNLSAGGPIVHPTMQALIATGICPHTLAARPVVLPPSPPLILEFEPRHGSDLAVLWIDGQESWSIAEGDKVSLEANEMPLNLIMNSDFKYYSVLRRKLNWSGEMPPQRVSGPGNSSAGPKS